MTTIPQPTIDRLLKEQGNKCVRCWRTIPPHAVHHAVYTRDKRVKELDDIQNLQLIGPTCHSNHGRLSSWFMRCRAYSEKIDLGYNMENWCESLPLLIKDNFIYLGEEEHGKR